MLRGGPATASSGLANLAGKGLKVQEKLKPESRCIFQGRLRLEVRKN